VERVPTISSSFHRRARPIQRGLSSSFILCSIFLFECVVCILPLILMPKCRDLKTFQYKSDNATPTRAFEDVHCQNIPVKSQAICCGCKYCDI